MSNQYKIENISVSESKQEKVKFMLCQLRWDNYNYEKHDDLFFLLYDEKIRASISRLLNISQKKNVDLIIFPELSIPEKMLEELYAFASTNNTYIIAGTHYKKTDDKYISICPIISPNKIYYTHKINPSPFETSSFPNCGLQGGNTSLVFQNTKIGNFAVTICADYIDEQLKQNLNIDFLDLLIVPAFQRQSEMYYRRMQTDTQNSKDGLYILYSNFIKENGADGNSALFGIMDHTFEQQFVEHGCTDMNPENKIYQLLDTAEYVILELNLKNKKPSLGKNLYTERNINVLEQDDRDNQEKYDFIGTLGVNDDKYKYIEDLFVVPNEYEEIKKSLDEKNIVLILGDPGIGKTYTAINLLFEYFQEGYKPRWLYGLSKEEREIQRDNLIDFEPREKEIVYFEDPFGRIQFERKDDLIQIFIPLLLKIRASKSKMIVTSRSDVFERFSKETLDRENLFRYSQEMNIRKPSYSIAKLKEIANKYLKFYTNWNDNEELRNIVFEAINKGFLLTPLMIYNLVRENQFSPESSHLRDVIKIRTTNDLTLPYSNDIKNASMPTKIFLYMVFLMGNIHIKEYQDIFERMQIKLLNKNIRFEYSTLSSEIDLQIGYRVQRIGIKKPIYRFSHPTFEEVLVKLIGMDSSCTLIFQEIFQEVFLLNQVLAHKILSRLIVKYPPKALILYNHIKLSQDLRLEEEIKVEMCNKMLFSKNEDFEREALLLYPLKDLLNSLYKTTDDSNLFLYKLRLLKRRNWELINSGTIVNWMEIFTKDRIKTMQATRLLNSIQIAFDIDNEIINKIDGNFYKVDIQKKFITLPNGYYRNQFNELLKESRFKNVYNELEQTIPSSEMDYGRKAYVKILKKYVFAKEQIKGSIVIDDGALNALQRKAKLYPVGIISVEGRFDSGDIIEIKSIKGNVYFISMVELSADFIQKYKGYRTTEITEMTYEFQSTIVSRDMYRYRIKYDRIYYKKSN